MAADTSLGDGENQSGFLASGASSARQGGDRAFEGQGTQGASRGHAIVKPDPATRFVGQSVNQQGNTLALRKREPGRIWRKLQGADRPAAFSSARFVTGVNPEEPINDSPYWPRA